MKSTRMYCLILAVLTALAPRAHAQFGSGIVYDPTQSAHAIQEIQQGESQLQKWAIELNNWQQHLIKEAQIFTTAEQTRTQIVTMYNLAYQMATMPQNLEARYKADWAQWQSLAAEYLRQHLAAGKRAQLWWSAPGAAGLQQRLRAGPKLPFGKLLVSRLPDPSHRRQPVRHVGAGANDHDQHAFDTWDNPHE
jgi:hypothetical protein